jgi:GalNAc5-diNAcBac-PP-undecaprenol beta-1,3-glucosyltransferase
VTAATVLIPTHEHVESLRHAVAGVQQQTLQDFELFIVGDGVSDASRVLINEFITADDRIRFFDFPKGPRKGEIHRHEALQYAQGRFVAYLGDDDIWLPNHLEILGRLLVDADFGHTLQVGVDANGNFVFLPADLENPIFRERMLTELFNRFDFTFAGHTMEAYRRLPYGWRTTPPDFPWTDLYMWRQFLAEPWCRARSAMVPTGINTWTHQRPHLNDRERAEDIANLRAKAELPGFREELWQAVARRFACESVSFELEARRSATTLDTTIAQTKSEMSGMQGSLKQMQGSLEQSQASLAECRIEIARLEARRAVLTAELEATRAELEAMRPELEAMRVSTSWRLTYPMRQVGRFIKAFRR